MREREQKLVAELDGTLPRPERLLKGVGSWALEEIDQEAVYFDTEDLRLTRAGVSLRYRSDDGWTVKLPESSDGDTFVRQEHSFVGEDGAPPVAAAELVRAWTRSSALRSVARIRTHRRKLHVVDAGGSPIGEIDDDEVTARVTHQSVKRFREIEVEMYGDTDPRLAEVVVRRLRKSGIGGGASMPKIARALGEAASAPPDVVPPARLDRHATLGDLVRSSISASVLQLVAHDPIIRIDDDPEGVHKARVATRRMRSDLRTFRPVLDQEWSEPLRDELRWLGEELGRVRDGDVLMRAVAAKAGELRHHNTADGLVERLREARQRDLELLLGSMRSARYSDLLDRLIEAASTPVFREGLEKRRAKTLVEQLVRHPWKRLRKEVRNLPDAPADSDLHEVRKRAKQARYALESVGEITGPHARKTAKRLADLQDVLGDHQDAVVAAAWLEDAARDSSGATAVPFVAGVLAGSFGEDRRKLRRRWPKAWKRARKQGGSAFSV